MTDTQQNIASLRKGYLKATAAVRDLTRRIEEAEAIIRAKNTLEIAMYNSDFEASLPRKANELESAYCQRYNVDLDGEDS